MGDMKRLGREVRRFELSLRQRAMTDTQELLLVRLARTLKAPGPISVFRDRRGRRWEIWDLATANVLVG